MIEQLRKSNSPSGKDTYQQRDEVKASRHAENPKSISAAARVAAPTSDFLKVKNRKEIA
jgi:hypothetical protein